MTKLTVGVLLTALVAVCCAAPFATQKKHDRNDYTKNPHRIICYIGSWAEWHAKPYDFNIEKINTEECTHLAYGFAILDEYEHTIKVFDPALDLGKTAEITWAHDGYKRFVNLRQKNPELTTMIALGGWFEGSEKYSDMVKTAASRTKFVNSVMDYLKKYDFDGLDMDWEYPANRLGKPEDKENFLALMVELSEAFKPEGYVLSAALSPGKPTIDKAYDRQSIAKLNEVLDWANVMTYDYHGGFDDPPYLRHNAPLYNRPDETEDILVQFTVNYTINYFLELGLKKEKMNMGMPFYGRGHSLKTSDKHNPDDLGSEDMSPEGPASQQEGVLGYDELCMFEQEQSGWHNEYDPYWKAPYAYKDTSPIQWLGYDNPTSLICKVSFLKEKGLGGAMAWSLEFDDFNNNCKGGTYPLLKTVHKYLNGDKKAFMECPIEPPKKPTTTARPTTTEPTTPTTEPTTPTTEPTTPTTEPTTPTTEPTTPTTEPTTPTTQEPTTPTTQEPTTPTTQSPTPEPTPEPTEEPKVTTITPGGDVIRCYEEGKIAHPTDKHKYVVCKHIINGHNDGWYIYIMGCPAGTKWKETKKNDGECIDDD